MNQMNYQRYNLYIYFPQNPTLTMYPNAKSINYHPNFHLLSSLSTSQINFLSQHSSIQDNTSSTNFLLQHLSPLLQHRNELFFHFYNGLCGKCDVFADIRKINLMIEAIINPQKTIKTFVFEKEETQQSQIVDYEVDFRQNFINLNYLLSIYCPLNHHRVSIYDPNSNRFTTLNKLGAENGFLHKQYLEPRVILVRYKRAFEYAPDSDGVDSSLEPDSQQDKRDGRSKERTIAEVIQLVKRWRNLHLHGHKSLNRRLNLQDAARLVGISKKSLDDYYCQLRLGEFYNFDFANKLHQKMGVLRSHVKDYKPEKDQRRRQNQKHPKNLRVIEQFEIQTKTLLPLTEEQMYQVQKQEEGEKLEEEIPLPPTRQFDEERYSQGQGESNQVFEELFNLEHDFFKGFELVLDEPIDPYMDIDRDFRKKDFDEESSGFLYFDA